MADAEDPKPKAAKPRGPVRYIAFGEITPGWWALMAADREAANVYELRKALRAELNDAQAEAGVQVTDELALVIIPIEQAHVVGATRKVAVTETFEKITLQDGPPLASMLAGPQPAPETEADVAARMAAGAPQAAAEPGTEPVMDDAAAQAAERALAAARRVDPSAGADAPRAVPAPRAPINPDIDPETGLSRRSAAQARPEDEGTVVFPLDDAE